MAYQLATSKSGKLYVVLAMGKRIVRVVRQCDDRADADRLLRDLSDWRF